MFAKDEVLRPPVYYVRDGDCGDGDLLVAILHHLLYEEHDYCWPPVETVRYLIANDPSRDYVIGDQYLSEPAAARFGDVPVAVFEDGSERRVPHPLFWWKATGLMAWWYKHPTSNLADLCLNRHPKPGELVEIIREIGAPMPLLVKAERIIIPTGTVGGKPRRNPRM